MLYLSMLKFEPAKEVHQRRIITTFACLGFSIFYILSNDIKKINDKQCLLTICITYSLFSSLINTNKVWLLNTCNFNICLSTSKHIKFVYPSNVVTCKKKYFLFSFNGDKIWFSYPFKNCSIYIYGKIKTTKLVKRPDKYSYYARIFFIQFVSAHKPHLTANFNSQLQIQVRNISCFCPLTEVKIYDINRWLHVQKSYKVFHWKSKLNHSRLQISNKGCFIFWHFHNLTLYIGHLF